MARIIGIDLGTTNSAVAVMEGGEPRIIVNEEGNRLTPSVVAWDASGQVLVGQIAKRQAITNAENTIYSAKRFIGRRHEEVVEEVRRVPFEVTARANGDVAFVLRGQQLTPEEVSSHILRKLKKAAEDHLGEPVDRAVITVPAYFNDSQRQATRDAGRIAGLEVARIINEPTAAALAYGLDKKRDELIAVYDFGGGTFDISVLEVGDNVVQVVSTNGDTHLGGDDVDRLVVDYLLQEFRKETGMDASRDKIVLQRLKDAAEKAKVELSSTLETEINLPFLSADASGPKHLAVRLSRAKLEAMVEPLVERSFEAVKRALSDARKTPADIDEVVLVGGSTRMPIVQQRVRSFFGKDPHRGVNPDEVVALGAAVQGGVLAGEVQEVVLLDVTPLSLGVETLGGVMTTLIPRNTTVPAHAEETFSTAEDEQTRVDVHVLQGERPTASDNRTLGRFHLEGIRPAPRGAPKIKVSFDIDANGILSVTAKDEETGKDQRITITAAGGLSEQDVQRMVADAARHAEEDERRRAEIELRNEADQAIYIANRTLSEMQGRVPQAELERAKSAVEVTQRALDQHDGAAIRASMDELSSRMRELASRAAAPPPPPGGPGREGPRPEGRGREGDVIDAEFEETH